MENDLYIGDYAYSSWSLRGWLLINRFGIPARHHMVPFAAKNVAEQLQKVYPAKTVPTLVTGDGSVISESLAMAEELATRYPNAGIWPADPKARAVARTMSAEMAASFMALRNACPMNLRASYTSFEPAEDVLADIARLEIIWAHARTLKVSDGPWLLGDYSAADAFFAPVAARIAGYGLLVSKDAQAYVDAHLADPAFRRWRAMGLVHGPDLPWYARDYDQRMWPAPQTRPVNETGSTVAENETCPYSGKAPTHFFEMDGKVYGFCNAFCRDKTAVDPEAWPAFMKIVVR